MQKAHELGNVVNINFVLAEQRVLEGNVDAAIGIFDIEDYGVASDFAPVADDAESVIAGGHYSGEVDGADFEISGDGNRFFDDGRGQDSGDGDLFAVFQDVAGAVVVYLTNRFGELRRSQIRGAL